MQLNKVKVLHQTVIHENSEISSLIMAEETEIQKWPLACLNEICPLCFLKSNEFAELKKN